MQKSHNQSICGNFKRSQEVNSTTNSLENMQDIKPSTSTENDSVRFDTIKSLNLQKLNWRIRAKVTESTGDTNSAGGNRYIRVLLEDRTGKINAFAWGNNVDKFVPILIQDQTVEVSRAKLEKCNSDIEGFIKYHECKILLQPITEIVKCSSIKTKLTKYTSFKALQKKPNGTITNCKGTVIYIGDLESKKSTKTEDRYFDFRKLILEDKQKNRIDLDLWNEHAKRFCGKLQDVLAVKDLKVNIYEGNHQFSTLLRSKLDVNPDCFEAGVLKQCDDNVATDTAGPVKRKRKTTTKATGTPKPEKKKKKNDTPSAQRVPEEASVDNGASNHTKAKDTASAQRVPEEATVENGASNHTKVCDLNPKSSTSRTKVEKKGEHKKIFDDTVTQSVHNIMDKQIESVGSLIFHDPIGTVFVVGDKYVMTAWHVVYHIISDILSDGLDYTKLDQACINFRESPCQPPTQYYYIEQKIPFFDKKLDIVVLEIKRPFNNLPRPLLLCSYDITKPNSNVTDFTLIGYGKRGSYKKHIEHGCQIITPNAERLTEAIAHLQTKWEGSDTKTLSDYYKFAMNATSEDTSSIDDGYSGHDDQSKLICDCHMEKGASGSPAVTAKLRQGTAYVVGVLTNGIPDFYFSLPEEIKAKFRKDYRFEMATKMSYVYNSMCRKNEPLAKELFNH